MKGDFSRIRFNPANHYSAVLQQQGRVALDTDANEESAIDGHLRETANVDIIGQFGGPIGDAGFSITISLDGITIGAGRYYVDGILVENEADISYDAQSYLIGQHLNAKGLLEGLIQAQGRKTAHFQLEVWQRLVTELDDPCLQEPALGQADTTARLQTVWRVVGLLADDTARTTNISASSGAANTGLIQPPASRGSTALKDDPIQQLSPCCQLLYRATSAARSGTLTADTGQPSDDCGCDPIPAAGYRGLENQLYRVEIHNGGTLDTATFKWSRENGSVVTHVTDINGATLTVSNLGPDANLGFQAGQWVELTDDTYQFGPIANQPGELYQILQVFPTTSQVKLTTPVTGIDTSQNARMRRWDQGGSATAQGIPLSTSPIQLENGIEVSFRNGKGDGNDFLAGDYWTIPARTASGQIDWPPCDSDGSFFQPAHFTRIHVAPLACLHWTPPRRPTTRGGVVTIGGFTIDDCRLLFPPLTAVASGTKPAALHLKSISWANDEVMTVDDLLKNGLFVTFDRNTSCPWSGGNFCVSLELPRSVNLDRSRRFDSSDIFLRTVFALDPPAGIAVSGNQVTWLAAEGTGSSTPGLIEFLYNQLSGLFASFKDVGYARVRVKLLGGEVYGVGDGREFLHLDGQSFGLTGGDGQIDLADFSGNGVRASDFESWFYLAPPLRIANLVIQGVEASGNLVTPLAAVTVTVNPLGQMIGLDTGTTAVVPLSGVQALVTLSDPPLTDTVVALTLSGVVNAPIGGGPVATVPASVTIPKGQISATVPFNIQASPGPGVTDAVTWTATVNTAIGNLGPSAPLAITGGPIPQP